MTKKYELTDEKIVDNSRMLYRIRALRDFGNIKAGQFGGFIEQESNLSHEGNCWICDNAKVTEHAIVKDDAFVCENALICNTAVVANEAIVSGFAIVSAGSYILNHSKVFGNARILGSVIKDYSVVSGEAWIEDAKIYGISHICGNAKIRNYDDYLVVGPIGSRYDHTTFMKMSNGKIWVKCGCFEGTIEEFRAEVKDYHRSDYKSLSEYLNAMNLAEHKLLMR